MDVSNILFNEPPSPINNGKEEEKEFDAVIESN